MFYIYILKSVHFNKSYVGKTSDIERRLKEHNDGKSLSTRKFRPWLFIYKEECQTEQEAIKRERSIKSRSGRRWMKKIFNNQ